MGFCIILPSRISGGGPRLKSPVSNVFGVENYRAKEKEKKEKKEKKKKKKEKKKEKKGRKRPQGYLVAMWQRPRMGQ